jgi:D-alanyl-D-alanine carboxypeptidase/D-alanyl-D-alanine-endopeptidase (penicillin-binding protein 4)
MMFLGADSASKSPAVAPLGVTISRETAVAALNRYAVRMARGSRAVELVDGSGLSHDNRAPTELFCAVLHDVAQDPNIDIELEHSLPVSGRSGTLRERDFDLPQGRVRAKTGTINGVSSLAGYLVSRRGNKYAFAVVSNSSRTKAESVQIEDRFVRALYNDSDQ